MFRHICEQIRNAVDDQGATGCYQDSVEKYSKATGIPVDGLWAAVDAVLQGYTPEKFMQRLQKSWGGTPDQWVRWVNVVKTRPDCAEVA